MADRYSSFSNTTQGILARLGAIPTKAPVDYIHPSFYDSHTAAQYRSLDIYRKTTHQGATTTHLHKRKTKARAELATPGSVPFE